jgi:hypothetical protein
MRKKRFTGDIQVMIGVRVLLMNGTRSKIVTLVAS